VWATKYRYIVLTGDIQKRCRELLIQVCDLEDVIILKGVVRSDHVDIYIEYPPTKSISSLMKKLKGRSSRRLQEEYSNLRKVYWGKYFLASGYGAWSTGNITDKMVDECLEHHRKGEDDNNTNFILE